MTHSAAATRTWEFPAVGHKGRRRGRTIMYNTTAPALVMLATVGASIALTGPGDASVDHALGLDWSTAWSVGGGALGVSAAFTTLLLRRQTPAQPGTAGTQTEPLRATP